MNQTIFDATDIEIFPDRLPLFPVGDMILLPRTHLPLNIFEPRYLRMVETVLANGRFIGVVQTVGKDQFAQQSADLGTLKRYNSKKPPLQKFGGLGRIVHFEENSDNRLEIVIKGECRFSLAADRQDPFGFRVGKVAYDDFESDLEPVMAKLPRKSFFSVCKKYFNANELNIDWESLEQVDDERIVNSLSMFCPLQAIEKQALLEKTNFEDRTQLLVSLMEMAIMEIEISGERQSPQ
ncbi:MAG: LON peptidase substrate-binding domain-containing protein [Alphaproteobacteria bacterium]